MSSALESRSYAEGIRYENWQGKGSNYTDGFAYGQSKLANVFMAQQLYRRFGVASVSVHPGIIATDLGRYRTLSGFLDYVIGFLFNSARMNADQGSWNQLWAAVTPGLTEGHYWPVGQERPASHPSASDAAASAECWDRSHALLASF